MKTIKILTQTIGGMEGCHGTVGNITNMFDSFGEPLHIGDVVLTINQDEFQKKNHYIGDEYGLHFVCEEDTSIVSWTGKDHQYVMGIASVWNDEVFSKMDINIEDDDYFDELLKVMRGWIVKKMKKYDEVVEGETYDFLYLQSVDVD